MNRQPLKTSIQDQIAKSAKLESVDRALAGFGEPGELGDTFKLALSNLGVEVQRMPTCLHFCRWMTMFPRICVEVIQ